MRYLSALVDLLAFPPEGSHAVPWRHTRSLLLLLALSACQAAPRGNGPDVSSTVTAAVQATLQAQHVDQMPAPTSTNGGSLIASATPTPSIVFDEAFTSAPEGWPNTPQGPARYADGVYQLAPQVSGQFVAIDAPIADFVRDVSVSGRFHKSGGPAGGGYGLIVNDQGPDLHDGVNQGGRFLVLEVGDDGTVGAWQREQDQWIDLLPWTPSAAVHPGSAPNDLMVRTQDKEFTFLVNGIQVAHVTTKLTTGRIGVFVGGDGNRVVLEHFTVLNSSPTASSMQPQTTATLVVTLAPTDATTKSAGPVRHIRAPDDYPLLVMAPNVDDLEQLALAVIHDDKDGIRQLFASGQVVDWQAHGGRRVVVLGHVVRTNSSSSLVRILDGPRAGESGWVFDPELGP